MEVPRSKMDGELNKCHPVPQAGTQAIHFLYAHQMTPVRAANTFLSPPARMKRRLKTIMHQRTKERQHIPFLEASRFFLYHFR